MATVISRSLPKEDTTPMRRARSSTARSPASLIQRHPLIPLFAHISQDFSRLSVTSTIRTDFSKAGCGGQGSRICFLRRQRSAEDEHASRQLARPLEQLALWLEDPAARIFPSPQDLAEAQTVLSTLSRPLVAIHPGSGGERKNWPLERWQEVQRKILDDPRVGHLLIIGGESDSRQLAQMRSIQPAERQTILENLPLPVLGAVLSQCAWFVGHDSGISHLAAAAGIPLSAAVRSHQSRMSGRRRTRA